MSERDTDSRAHDDAARNAVDTLPERIFRPGETLPRWSRYVTVFDEEAAIRPSQAIRTGAKLIDVFNAGTERMNRWFSGRLYRSLLANTHEPVLRERFREAESQRIGRRIGQLLAALEDEQRRRVNAKRISDQ